MNTFTTKIKLEKTPLILKGIDEFLGKIVKITITVVEPEDKKKNKKKFWKHIGSVNLEGTLDNINLRDLAYE